MSAVAQIADARTVVPELHVAEPATLSAAEIQTKEMNRWLLWFGIPALFMAIFMGATFATSSLWGIGGVLFFLIADVCILIWLCISSDTNGVGVAPDFAHGH